MAGHPTYHVNVIKLKWEIIWTNGLPHLRGLPHLPGVPHLHVNRPLMVAKQVNKKNAGKPRVLAIYALLTLTCCSCWNLQWCTSLLLPLIMMQSHRPKWILREFDVSRIRPRLGGLPHLETFTWQTGLPALTCDQIKMRDYMDWPVTPPKRLTSPTWGPPRPLTGP